MRPKSPTYNISKDELDKLNIPFASNMVIVHVPHKNENTRTNAGVYVVGDTDFSVHHHVERWGYVYALPSSFEYELSRDMEQWDTDVECEVGDKVWFDYRAALNAYTFVVNGEWYKLLKYSHLYVAIRGEDIIPLNGYVLFKRFIPEKESEFLLDSDPDERFGIVAYAGSKNKRYRIDMFSDDIDIKNGDHVVFEEGTACFDMEYELHEVFGESVVLQQRKRILGVVDEDHDNILSLRAGVVGVKPREENLDKNGILLTREQRKQRVCDVVHSSHDTILENTIVLAPKKKGTLFNGIEYYTEERIFYYETA